MGFSMKSSDKAFFTLFSTAATHLVEGAKILGQITGAQHEERNELRDRMHEVEHAADKTTHEIAKRLYATFITPFDRDDVARMAGLLDDCMDAMDEAADFIVLYRLNDLPDGIVKQVSLLHRCAELTAEAMPDLRKPTDLRDFWVEINRLENEGDSAYRHLLAELFDSEHDPLTVIKLKDVVETLEQAMDCFEAVANTVEAIAIKES